MPRRKPGTPRINRPVVSTVLSVPDLAKFRELGWTYAQIANHVGVEPSTIGRYAKKHLPPNLRACRLANRPPPSAHCPRCDILFSSQAPKTRNGLCLYCDLEAAGVNLIQWHEAGGAAALQDITQ